MAETPHKRLREESYHINVEDSIHDSSVVSKRQKPYNNSNNVNILNLLDEEDDEEDTTRDLSAIFTTLQQELLSSTTTVDNFDSLPPPSVAAVADQAELSHHHVTSAECGGGVADENDGVKSVMRHLFEASDDELGIPNRNHDENNSNIGEIFPFSFNDQYHGLWELEDEAANYYTVLQSELFM